MLEPLDPSYGAVESVHVKRASRALYGDGGATLALDILRDGVARGKKLGLLVDIRCGKCGGHRPDHFTARGEPIHRTC